MGSRIPRPARFIFLVSCLRGDCGRVGRIGIRGSGLGIRVVGPGFRLTGSKREEARGKKRSQKSNVKCQKWLAGAPLLKSGRVTLTGVPEVAGMLIGCPLGVFS